MAVYSHLILFGVSGDDVMVDTQRVYDRRVETHTDPDATDLGDVIDARYPKRSDTQCPDW